MPKKTASYKIVTTRTHEADKRKNIAAALNPSEPKQGTSVYIRGKPCSKKPVLEHISHGILTFGSASSKPVMLSKWQDKFVLNIRERFIT